MPDILSEFNEHEAGLYGDSGAGWLESWEDDDTELSDWLTDLTVIEASVAAGESLRGTVLA